MKDQEQRLKDEILRDAAVTAKRRIDRARTDTQKALEKVRASRGPERARRMAEATRLADEKVNAVMADVDMEKRRRWLMAREAELDALFAAALQHVEAGEGIDPKLSLAQLLEEALLAMGPGELVLRMQPADRTRLDDAAIAALTARLFPDAAARPRLEAIEDAGARPGLVLASRDGRRWFDNTYHARLRRARRDLRALVCADMDMDAAGAAQAPGKEPKNG